jgi:hypothetical protein
VHGNSESVGLTKSVMAVCKDKCISYVSLNIETAPDISHGVVLVAYLMELPIESRYLVCDQDGIIRGVSRRFCKSFDVPPDYTENVLKTLLTDFN